MEYLNILEKVEIKNIQSIINETILLLEQFQPFSLQELQIPVIEGDNGKINVIYVDNATDHLTLSYYPISSDLNQDLRLDFAMKLSSYSLVKEIKQELEMIGDKLLHSNQSIWANSLKLYINNKNIFPLYHLIKNIYQQLYKVKKSQQFLPEDTLTHSIVTSKKVDFSDFCIK
ncbi:hypothetical protein CEP48_00505 [Mergibacter septicus]|uniref:Uncharacterized protein n=1 Tax=Mergibacter septicus TaxID=221402 RepID=A0A8D4IVV3_9PAST|nr:hypothetical protein [Mergibacter septicus]AWX14334.1 hypothetical protein CEP49_07165 [Mergibacter septicus]AWX14759.1 hypothetical protein CEP47_00505 [Mergibacter septicus]QDJ14010.1 hypothetical protein CEP48_00505 [Mergibacter septicus]UTU48541.1 hypothetical protein HLL31_07125 [Mergibacter septicus]WMR95830.1 hypothetical protein RDJ12_07875 [Mergibacter septicus]